MTATGPNVVLSSNKDATVLKEEWQGQLFSSYLFFKTGNKILTAFPLLADFLSQLIGWKYITRSPLNQSQRGVRLTLFAETYFTHPWGCGRILSIPECND